MRRWIVSAGVAAAAVLATGNTLLPALAAGGLVLVAGLIDAWLAPPPDLRLFDPSDRAA